MPHRISYAVPPPAEPTPVLALPPSAHPRNLSPNPLVWPRSPQSSSSSLQTPSRHPQHALGVTSLALDLSTVVLPHDHHLQKNSSFKPRGLLYSAGRDGLIVSWDLGLHLVAADSPYGRPRSSSVSTDRSIPQTSLPFEERWRVNTSSNPIPPSASFRQCIRPHTDWINDIVLCNLNRLVVSASSDHTVHVWCPHDTHQSMVATLLGHHNDYVKCLAACRDQNWVASGAFDKQIKIWDLAEGRPGPIFELPEPLKHSIYSLAVNPFGTVLAAGSPERVVRTWDPRSGKKLTSKLAGHTDNIRSLLVSEDGRKLISGSSDSTIRVWDLAMNRTVDSYSYHPDSVWSLYSNHQNLDIFYSGDKSGTVCKVDTTHCTDASEGECLVLCKDPDAKGISKIVATSDKFIWTANNTSTVRCWSDVRPRLQREDIFPRNNYTPSSVVQQPSPVENSPQIDSPINRLPDSERQRFNVSFVSEASSPTVDDKSPINNTFRSTPVQSTNNRSLLKRPQSPESSSIQQSPLPVSSTMQTVNGVPFESLVPLTPLDDPYGQSTMFLHQSIDDAVTLHSMTSALSMFGYTRGGTVRPHSLHSQAENRASIDGKSYLMRADSGDKDIVDDHEFRVAQQEYELRETAADAIPLLEESLYELRGRDGIIKSIIFNDRRHVLTVDTAGIIELWDIIMCSCVGRFDPGDIAKAFEEQSGSEHEKDAADSESMNIKYLELVKSRIEGEGTVQTWCQLDTRTGGLIVHMHERDCFDGEMYLDEFDLAENVRDHEEDFRMSMGQVMLKSLFEGFVATELELHGDDPATSHSSSVTSLHSLSTSSMNIKPPAFIPLHRPGMPYENHGGGRLSVKTPASSSIQLATPAETLALPPDVTSIREKLQSCSDTNHDMTGYSQQENGNGDYFNYGTSAESADDNTPRPRQVSTGFPLSTPHSQQSLTTDHARNSSNPGQERVASDNNKNDENIESSRTSQDGKSLQEQRKHDAIVAEILSKPLSPCRRPEVPNLKLPKDIMVSISKQDKDSRTWKIVYRGTIGSVGGDYEALEKILPLWAFEYLLVNNMPSKEASRMSFTLSPWKSAEEAGVRMLPGGNIRLTANRLLRIQKTISYIIDKLHTPPPTEALPTSAPGPPPSHSNHKRNSSKESSTDKSITNGNGASLSSSDSKLHDELEIVCNGNVLPPTATLAAVQGFIARGGRDLQLNYRKKRT